jgi:ribosome-binding protein aMBF1 (putative translation factor)
MSKTARDPRKPVVINGIEMIRLNEGLADKLADPDVAAELEGARLEAAFALALGRARDARQLSQQQLGDLAGIKQPQINRYEKGTIPDVEQLRRLVKALNARFVIEPNGNVAIYLA